MSMKLENTSNFVCFSLVNIILHAKLSPKHILILKNTHCEIKQEENNNNKSSH